MDTIISWLIATVAVMITAYLLPGVTISGFVSALLTVVAIGFINAFIRPVLLVLALPLNALTLGLFTWVINALLIMIAGAIVPGFQVKNFWWALLFSLVLTVIMSLLGQIF